MAEWEAVEFAYDMYVRAPAETIKGTWDEAIIAAVTRRKAHRSRRDDASADTRARRKRARRRRSGEAAEVGNLRRRPKLEHVLPSLRSSAAFAA